MLDSHLAELYEVETKRLKEAVRRNLERFPSDFMFELTREEYNSLRTQNATLESGRGKYSKFNPFVFTEQGVAMLASILNSSKAIQVNITIVRAFVAIRQNLGIYKELKEQIEALESTSDQRFKDVYEALDLLFEDKKFKNRNKIGF